MDNNWRELLLKFKPLLEKPTRKWWMLFIAMTIVFLIGIYALIIQIKDGHIVTGMRDHVVWGVFIVDFIFLLGFSYAGALLGCGMHLLKIKWGRPLNRIIELITFIMLCVGPLFIFLCIGRLDRIHHLFLYARIQSPITWDVIAIITDLVFCFTYLYITHIRDFALLRDTKEVKIPKWKRKLYTKLSLGFDGRPEQVKNLNQAQNILAAIIIPTSILAYSLLAWLFGMSQRPGWHSTIFAPHFVLTALFSGVALVIVLMWVYRRLFKLEDFIRREHFLYLGYGLLLLILMFGYFSFSEYITEWYNVSKTSGLWIDKFLNFNQYGFWSLATIMLSMILPLIILVVPRLRTIGNISLAAFMVIIGLWIRRYLIIVPTLETPYLPIQDLRPEYVSYSATWIEWVLTAAGLALCVIMFMLFNILAPVVPIAEAKYEDEIEVPGPFYQSIKNA
jgi:molybdopterin-containing oxidoreductase family membrane subunit